MYFNYLLDTGDVNSNAAHGGLDAIRVQISADGVTWETLATSNFTLGTDAGETPRVLTPQGGSYRSLEGKQRVQGLFESDDTLPPEAEDPDLKVWRRHTSTWPTMPARRT